MSYTRPREAVDSTWCTECKTLSKKTAFEKTQLLSKGTDDKKCKVYAAAAEKRQRSHRRMRLAECASNRSTYTIFRHRCAKICVGSKYTLKWFAPNVAARASTRTAKKSKRVANVTTIAASQALCAVIAKSLHLGHRV